MLMESLETYLHGTRPIVTATFTDAAGQGRTATDCLYSLKSPSGVTTTYDFGTDTNVTNPSTNVFACELPALNEDGDWYVNATATAGFDAPAEAKITISRSVFH